jgi:VWFA-related protein
VKWRAGGSPAVPPPARRPPEAPASRWRNGRRAAGAPLLFFALSVFAQETIEVHLVEVPVTVADSAGNPIRGLTQKNFTILDNGKPRTITSFDVVDFASQESVSAISPLNPVARRSFLILFDLGYARPNSLQRAQKAARDFVQTALLPRDLASVATIDVDGTYKLLTAFTSDRALIASAIDNPAAFRGKDPLGIANQTLAFQSQLDPSGMSNLGDAGSGKAGMGAQHEDEMARNSAWMNEQFNRQRVEKHVDALGDIARTLEGAIGRKQVVLLSEGVPAKILTGRDAHDVDEMNRQADRITRGLWYTANAEMADSDQDQRYGSSSTLTLLDRMKQYFRRSDVVLHAIDLQGARVQQTTQEGKVVNSNEGLATLARATGGTMFENSNNVGENFKRLLKQQEVVYILGFQTSETDKKFHNLEVKLNGVPRRTRAEYRDGYFPSRAAEPIALTDAQVIMNDIAQDSVHIASLAAPMAAQGDLVQVPVVIEVDGRDLVNSTPLNATARLVVYAFDESGVVRDRLFETLSFDPSKLTGGIKYFGTLSLPPGNYAIKSLLRIANSGRRGYARANIRVPHKGELGLVSFVIDEKPSQWTIVKGEAHGENAGDYPFQIDGEPIVPSVLPRIKAGDSRKVAVFVQNAEPEELMIDGGPSASQIRSVKGNGSTKIIMQADSIGASGVDIAVIKSKQTALRAHIPVILEEGL